MGGVQVSSTNYGGLGLVASTVLSSNDIVVQVPSQLVLDVTSPNDGNKDVLALFRDKQVYRSLPWFAQLSLQLNALDKGLIYGGLPKKPWLDALPRKFDTPIHWPESTKSELQYNFMRDGVKLQDIEWKKMYDDVIGAMNPEFCKKLAYDDFVWGCECARSRAFSGAYAGSAFNPAPYAFTLLLVTLYVGLNMGTVEQAANGAAIVFCANIWKDFVIPKFLKSKKYVICPFIDMANHVSANEAGNVSFEYFGDSYSLTMKGGVQEGSEVFISYGARSNDQLLQYYGFVENENPHDVYTFVITYRHRQLVAFEKRQLIQLSAAAGRNVAPFQKWASENDIK